MRGLGLAVALAGLAFLGAGCAGAHHANASMRPGGILASGNCWNVRTHGGTVTRTRFKCADYHPVVYQCVSGCTVSFHSSRHHYTVEQVREAFAAQGIFLVPNPQLAGPPGTVLLHRGDKPPHMVVALVNVSGGAGPGRHYLGTGYHLRRHGNVLVYVNSTNARPAAAALALLH